MSNRLDELTYETTKILNNSNTVILLRHPYPEEDLYSIYHDGEKLLETHSIQICNRLMWHEVTLYEKHYVSGVVCYNAKWHRKKARTLMEIHNGVQWQYLKKQNAKAY